MLNQRGWGESRLFSLRHTQRSSTTTTTVVVVVVRMMSIYISSSPLVLLHNHSSVTMVGSAHTHTHTLLFEGRAVQIGPGNHSLLAYHGMF